MDENRGSSTCPHGFVHIVECAECMKERDRRIGAELSERLAAGESVDLSALNPNAEPLKGNAWWSTPVVPLADRPRFDPVIARTPVEAAAATRPCSFAWRTTEADHRCTLARHALFGRHEEYNDSGLVAWYDDNEKAGGYGPCPLKECNRLMPHEHGPSSFASPGNDWFKPATIAEIIKIAEAVKSGKTTSYVEAAKVLAGFVLESEPLPTQAETLKDGLALRIDPPPLTFSERPKIVCLVGSTRFGDAFAKANLDETLAGNIILSVGCTAHSDSQLGLDEKTKAALDELHKRKIDLCDEVLVLNVLACKFCKKPRIIEGEPEHRRCSANHGWDALEPHALECKFEPYIGDSTKSEIAYAAALGKPIRWLNPPEVKP